MNSWILLEREPVQYITFGKDYIQGQIAEKTFADPNYTPHRYSLQHVKSSPLHAWGGLAAAIIIWQESNEAYHRLQLKTEGRSCSPPFNNQPKRIERPVSSRATFKVLGVQFWN